MNSKQESRLSEQMVARDFLLVNTAITNTLPNCAGYITGVQTGISQIQTIRELQEFDKTGITLNKTQLKMSLIAQSIDVSRRLVAYANYVNNTVLLKEIDYTESDLKKSADTVLKDRCQVIYDRANSNLAALGSYGVTAAILAPLLITLNAYNVAIPKPRLGIADKKVATTQIASLLKAVDDNLKKIDILVKMVKTTQPNFYNEYQTARMIVETGVGSLALKGKVTDAVSGNGLKGATITITNNTSGVFVVKKSADKGGYYLRNLREGNYIVKVTIPGYRGMVSNVSIVSGNMSVLNVEMSK